MSARAVTVRAAAKINIHLGVGPRRPDGFHDLSTVFHAVSLFDTVVARPATGISLTLDGGELAGVPADANNLAVRAARAVAGRSGLARGVALTVTKQIPVAAGLAGGSADAAAALRACDALWGTALDDRALAALAAELGSDVPFSLIGGTALGTGRGEIVRPLPVAAVTHWVIAAAPAALSTPRVYAELDAMRDGGIAPRPVPTPAAAVEALRTGDLEALAATLANDLQPAALRLAPYLAETLGAGRAAGALAGIVSGSGPTCVFLVRGAAQAEEVAGRLEASGTCRFARPVVGGVPGARLSD